MLRCSNQLKWLLSMWGSSGSTPSPSWVIELLILSLREYPVTLWRKLISTCIQELIISVTTQSSGLEVRVGMQTDKAQSKDQIRRLLQRLTLDILSIKTMNKGLPWWSPTTKMSYCRQYETSSSYASTVYPKGNLNASSKSTKHMQLVGQTATRLSNILERLKSLISGFTFQTVETWICESMSFWYVIKMGKNLSKYTVNLAAEAVAQWKKYRFWKSSSKHMTSWCDLTFVVWCRLARG